MRQPAPMDREAMLMGARGLSNSDHSTGAFALCFFINETARCNFRYRITRRRIPNATNGSIWNA
jgi:hypothetical protein